MFMKIKEKYKKSPNLVAQTAGCAVCGSSMITQTGRGPQTRRSALQKSGEQTQNVYENKAQGQKVVTS